MHQDQTTYSPSMMNMNMNPNTNLEFPEHEHLTCPRCDSNNTKFCYYNNYNLLQPRHYCKNCRRYWTKGGTLRRIPIGGSTRKTTKRASTSTKRPATSSTLTAPPQPQLNPESSANFSFDDNRCTVRDERSNHREHSGSFVDDLGRNLIKTSGNDGLNITPASEVCRRKDLSVNYDNYQSGGEGREGSSGGDGGRNGWPHLPIFRSGFNYDS
ncbi:hypothetical protein E3N88_21419 [Mikania micrantha]|uniref:Dof zinc finger protein n=1 Tax=Mikania micrantha TaxID=192012 RepID=A0A5N6NJQ2_9ASTR|nr:hypothetical protein E3N88_21419 [Mikania micrantha]